MVAELINTIWDSWHDTSPHMLNAVAGSLPDVNGNKHDGTLYKALNAYLVNLFMRLLPTYRSTPLRYKIVYNNDWINGTPHKKHWIQHYPEYWYVEEKLNYWTPTRHVATAHVESCHNDGNCTGLYYHIRGASGHKNILILGYSSQGNVRDLSGPL